jgi:transketolase
MAAGIAYAMRLEGTDSTYRVFVVMGDGEMDEGQVWEAAATIAHYNLWNVVPIVDVNGFQLDGPTRSVKRKDDLAQRWEGFGWQVLECDGHSHADLLRALRLAETARRPVVVLAHTRRGNGLGLLEKYGLQHLDGELRALAMKKLSHNGLSFN